MQVLSYTQQHFNLYTKICYDLKFQIIYEKLNDIKSKKIGFKIFMQNSAPQNHLCFYSLNLNIVNNWITKLGQLISQYGFHTHYKAVRRLGKGQFATVFQVQQLITGKRLAVKAFSKSHLLKTQNAMQSLKNQISIMRVFNHKNLQSLHQVYQSNNSIYLVTQILKGGTLYERLPQLFMLPHQQKLQHIKYFMNGLLQALLVLKDLQIVHRDLKLDNIMIRQRKSFEAVIIDFGLATFTHKLPYLFNRCGTPGYVSPQVMALKVGNKIIPQSDVFCAGAVFYYLLLQKPLFQGKSAEQILSKNKKFNIQFPQISQGIIDQDGLNLLKRMLQIDSSKRITVSQALMDPFLSSDQSIRKQNDGSSTTMSTLSNQNIPSNCINLFNV